MGKRKRGLRRENGSEADGLSGLVTLQGGLELVEETKVRKAKRLDRTLHA